MTVLELENLYKTSFRFIVTLLRTDKYKDNELVKQFTEEIRDYMVDASGLNTLPEVPKD